MRRPARMFRVSTYSIFCCYNKMEALVKVATCNLNQWAMDFEGNLANVVESIVEAKKRGARLRIGPELEIPGYGCEDHFLEQDTFFHSWESLATILSTDLTDGIVCDIGMPVLHRGVRYNCRVITLNRKILLIRPKLFLADDGNYRETRWFTSWHRQTDLDEHVLTPPVAKVTGQRTVPFGVAIMSCNDTAFASETCEELFTPRSPHIALSLNGAEIICNGSGSHHNLRKLNLRTDLMISATAKSGGVYMYANQQGCDGGRLYYDGCALVVCNGKVLAQASQFSLKNVEVVTAVIDLEEVRTYRGVSSRSKQASSEETIPIVLVDFDMCSADMMEPVSVEKPIRFHCVEEEVAFGPSCWLWDYLRRSGAAGFFLPLSGGADSSATATIVSIMCETVMNAVNAHDQNVIDDVRRIIGEQETMPSTAAELCNMIFFTAYLGTSNSSNATRDRARDLASEIGSYHLSFNIDSVISALLAVFSGLTGKLPQFRSHGGSNTENLALQNIQARIRMVFSFMLAQLMPWVRSKKGFLLVLGSANVDEALRGYMTKYDCSSADINPIGGISKNDLKRFLLWSAENLNYMTLLRVVEAPPTAELEPITSDYVQTDEVDMAMSYKELGVFGRLRNIYRCGPLSMYERLKHSWVHLRPTVIAEKVKRFFYYYSVNRHKLTVLTPSYHAENYSPDDNRFDHRQFLYNTKWTRQFDKVDSVAEHHEQSAVKKTE